MTQTKAAIKAAADRAETRAKAKPTKTTQAKAMGVVDFPAKDEYEDAAKLTKAIEDIKAGVTKLETQLIYILTGICVQIVCKPDVIHGLKLANDLMSAIGEKTVKRSMIISWLTKNAPIKYDKETRKFETKNNNNLIEMREDFKADRVVFVKERNTKPYSSEEHRDARKADQKFDFDKLLKALIKKAEYAKREELVIKAGGKSDKFSEVKLGSYADIKAGKFDALGKFVKVAPAKPDAAGTEDKAGVVQEQAA